jgi:hypothetical protein
MSKVDTANMHASSVSLFTETFCLKVQQQNVRVVTSAKQRQNCVCNDRKEALLTTVCAVPPCTSSLLSHLRAVLTEE